MPPIALRRYGQLTSRQGGRRCRRLILASDEALENSRSRSGFFYGRGLSIGDGAATGEGCHGAISATTSDAENAVPVLARRRVD